MPFFKKNFLRNFPHSFQKSLPHVYVLCTCRYVWAHWWILMYRSEADVIFLYYSPSWFLRQDLLLSLSSGNSARRAASEPPTPGLQALSTVPGIYVSARHLNWSPHAYITSTFPTEPSSHPRVSFLGLTSAILFLEVTKSESHFHSLVLRPSLADVNSVGGLERWLSAVHTCGPESAALELTWKQAWPHVPITAELGEGRHKDRFAKDRCYQPGWQTELQAQWETLSQGNGWRAIEGDAWNLLRPVHGHSHMCIWTTHTHTKTQQPQTTQTSTRSEKCLQQPWHLHGAQYQSQDGHCGHGHVEVFPPQPSQESHEGTINAGYCHGDCMCLLLQEWRGRSHPRSDEREGCEVRGLLHCQQVLGYLLWGKTAEQSHQKPLRIWNWIIWASAYSVAMGLQPWELSHKW